MYMHALAAMKLHHPISAPTVYVLYILHSLTNQNLGIIIVHVQYVHVHNTCSSGSA